MIWQFGEVGYDYNINYPGEIGGDEHRVDEKPIRWDYYDNYNRRKIYNVWSELIKLKKTYNTFRTSDFTMNVSVIMKRIVLNHPDMSAVVLGNFGVTSGSIDPQFPSTGTWYDYFSGDSLNVIDVNALVTLDAGKYKLYTNKKLAAPDFVGIGEKGQNSTIGESLIYPNPADNIVTIMLNLKEGNHYNIDLYDLQGRKIKQLFTGALSAGQQQVHSGIGDIKPGLYFVMISNENGKMIKKLVVQ
jgi:hypothetical protein